MSRKESSQPALDDSGISRTNPNSVPEFIDENDGGAGVRLKESELPPKAR